MKKSDIEKQKMISRLKKEINESKNIHISDGRNDFSLNESELKGLINEAVTNVLNKKGWL